jgi:XTP/dITP diphosphohydrolase
MFVPEGYAITFGEMDPEEKHAISHRAEAFRRFIAACLGPPAQPAPC